MIHVANTTIALFYDFIILVIVHLLLLLGSTAVLPRGTDRGWCARWWKFSVTEESVSIEIVMIIITGRSDAIVVWSLLQMKDTTVGGGIHPFRHHMMDGTARFPVSLIGKIRTKHDEERCTRDQDTHRVRMFKTTLSRSSAVQI